MSRIRFAVAFAVVFGVGSIASAQDTTKGTIRSINTDAHQVTIKGVVKDTVYNLKKDATVWLDGRSVKIGDLKTDDQAVVTYDKAGETFTAREVRALRNAKETSGTVRSVDKSRREVTLKGAIKDSTYELDKTGTVWVDGKQQSLAELRDGDEILVTYQKSGERWVASDVTVLKRK